MSLFAAAATAAATCLALSAPALADIRINEVESQSEGADWVELINTGFAPVDVGGYVIRDSGVNK
jgi:hypothetical protein